MPVILYVPQDPTDMVLQGEQMRISVNDQEPPAIGTVLQGAQIDTDWLNSAAMVHDEDAFLPMNSMVEGVRISMRRQKGGSLQIRANAGVATPCGAWVWLDYTPLMGPLLFASARWYVTGVTRDNTGSALGNCRVCIFDYGRLAVGAAQSMVGETISDGSGNYSIEVGESGPYQVIAYLPGSPNRAGISDVIEATAVN